MREELHFKILKLKKIIDKSKSLNHFIIFNIMVSSSGRIVFVTVGTTQFDELIQKICTPQFIYNLCCILKYDGILLQIGKTNFKPDINYCLSWIPKDYCHFTMDWFNLKPSGLEREMKDASLIISHCGSGSIFESLHLQKKVIAVINERLMDNHQAELAEELDHLQYIIKTTVKDLENLLMITKNKSAHMELSKNGQEIVVHPLEKRLSSLKSYMKPNLKRFQEEIDCEMGFL